MGAEINYEDFLKNLDERLKGYFESFGVNICCKKGCSSCCEKGDYPVTDIELEYLMKGFMQLDNSVKMQVQNNIKNMENGGVCPFLINRECSVYKYRPVVCRVHGLAYLYKDNNVKLPHCVNEGKNFSKAYSSGYFEGQPVNYNLDTTHLLEGFYSEIRNLYDWLYKNGDCDIIES